MNKSKKILHVVPDLGYGGVEKIILNCYEQLNHDNYFFDFVTHGLVEDYHQNLIENGNKIYYFKTIRQLGFKKYVDQIRNGLDIAKYDVIHIHTGHLTGLYAIVFKKAGAKKIVCHAHTTKCPNPKHQLFMPIFKFLANRYSDYRLACGVMAGEFCFGKGKFKFLPNGIDYNLYKSVTTEQINGVKKELGTSDASFVIGHIGHFSSQKNHPYVLKIAKEYIKINPDAKFVLVGEGPDFQKIKKAAEDEGLQENIIFAGVRKDIPVVMKSFDAFILPSLFEGLPVVSIEAQAAGTPSLLSDRIDKTLNINAGIMEFLSLDDNCLNWINALEDIRQNGGYPEPQIISERMEKTGYDINASARELGNIYDFVIGDKVNDSGK